MIQIEEKNHRNIVFFDKNLTDFHPNLLKLRSEVTGTEYEFDYTSEAELIDYFMAAFDFSECEDGEYIYTLTDGKTEHTGLIHIGKLEATEKVEYKANNVNIQYQTEF